MTDVVERMMHLCSPAYEVVSDHNRISAFIKVGWDAVAEIETLRVRNQKLMDEIDDITCINDFLRGALHLERTVKMPPAPQSTFGKDVFVIVVAMGAVGLVMALIFRLWGAI